MNKKQVFLIFLFIGLVNCKPKPDEELTESLATSPAPAAATSEAAAPSTAAPTDAPAAPEVRAAPTQAAPAATEAPSTAAPTAAATEAAPPSTMAPTTAEAPAAAEPAAPVAVAAEPAAAPVAAEPAAPEEVAAVQPSAPEAPAAAPAQPAPAAEEQMQGDQPAAAAEADVEEAGTVDCDAKLLEMDSCARKAMLMADPVIYENQEQVDNQFCANVTEHMRCMRDYKQCLTSFPRQVYSIVLFNIKKTAKNVCESNDTRQELVNNLQCFREKGQNVVITEIADMITRNLDYISDKEGDEMIQNLCCGYHAIEIEAKKVLDAECSSNLTTNYWNAISKSLLADASDLLCGSYQNADTCLEKVPQIMNFWTEKVKLTKVGDTYQTSNGTVIGRANPGTERLTYTALTPAVKMIKKLNAQMTNEVEKDKTKDQ